MANTPGRLVSQRRRRARQAGQDEALGVVVNAAVQPGSVWVRPNKQEQVARRTAMRLA